MSQESQRRSPTESLDPLEYYLNSASLAPLLNRDEEMELSQRVRAGQEASRELQAKEQVAREPEVDASTATARTEELHCAKRAGEQALQALVGANLLFGTSIAQKHRRGDETIEERTQMASIGLLDAARMFDHRRGFRFTTYAAQRVRGAITRELDNHGRAIRIPIHRLSSLKKYKEVADRLEVELGRQPLPDEIKSDLGVNDETFDEIQAAIRAQKINSLDAPLTNSDDNDTQLHDRVPDGRLPATAEAAIDKIIRARVYELLDVLNEDERTVILLHFGFADDREWSFGEVAELLKLKYFQVQRLRTSAFKKILSVHGDRAKALFNSWLKND